jgi:hypothetical protein
MSALLSKSASPENIESNVGWPSAALSEQRLYSKVDHASRTISKLHSYLRLGYLCDVAFICQDGQNRRRLVAHRLIISTLSDQFRQVFENTSQSEITLADVDGDILEKLIAYAYEGKCQSCFHRIELNSGTLEIHVNNATTLLITANRFHIVEIVHACERFLEKQLQPNNCLGLYRLAIDNHLIDLAKTTWSYAQVTGNESNLADNRSV